MKNIIIAAFAASLLGTTVYAVENSNLPVTSNEDSGCTSKLNKVSYDVKVSAENEGVSAQQLFDQAEVVKKVKPFLIKEIKKYTKMLSASDEAYSGVTTVDRIINEVCELKTPLWDAMSANQKTLMIGIDGTPNPYIRKTSHDAAVKNLQSQLDATKSTLSKTKNDLVVTKMQLTKAYKNADQAVIKAANNEIARRDAENSKKVKALEEKIALQGYQLTNLTASPHAVFVQTIPKFTDWTPMMINGHKSLCIDRAGLKTAATNVNIHAVCIVENGKLEGVNSFKIADVYSTDASDTMTLVLPNVVYKEYNLRGNLKERGVNTATYRGLRNGSRYQSFNTFSGKRVITNDPLIYNNSVVKKRTKKTAKAAEVEPLHVLIVNKGNKPVVQESTSWWH